MLSKHERYYGLGMDVPVIVSSRTRTLLWFGHGCSSYRVLSKHERYYGLGMDAPGTVCSRNMNVIMVWAWMLKLSCALETRTLLWFGHGCSSYRKLSNTNVIMVWAWMLQLPCALETRTLLWFGHGCSSYRVLSKHERYYGFGIVCSSCLLCSHHDKMPRTCRCFHIGSQVQVAASQRRF